MTQIATTKELQKLPLLSLLFLLITLQLGTSASYFGVGFMIISGLLLLGREPEWRSGAMAAFRENRLIALALALFVVIALVVMLFQRVTNIDSWGELKWVPIFLGMVVPAMVIMKGGASWEDRWVRRMTYALIAVTLFSCFASLYQFVTGDDPFRSMLFGKKGWGHRGHGLLRNPVPFAKLIGSLLLMGISACLVLWISGRKRWSLVSGAMGVACGMALLVSQSRGAWLALAVVGLAGIFLVPRVFRRIWTIAVIGAGLVTVTTFLTVPSLKSRVVTVFEDNPQKSNQTRLEQWHINWEILKENPLGVGFDGNDLREDYWYEKLGYEKRVTGHCHNEFIEIVVATGWLGLICYLFITVMMLIFPIRELRRMDLVAEPFVGFLLLSSLLVQIYLNGAVMTDQMDTQSRIVMSLMWAFVVARKVGR